MDFLISALDIHGILKQFIQQRDWELRNISAIGNISNLNNQQKNDLEECGIVMQNISSGKASAADIAILGELLKLTYFNKPPYGIILITADRDFSKILNFLGTVGYSIVLIHPPNISEVLLRAAKETIPWFSFIEGAYSCPSPPQSIAPAFNYQFQQQLYSNYPSSQQQNQQQLYQASAPIGAGGYNVPADGKQLQSPINFSGSFFNQNVQPKPWENLGPLPSFPKTKAANDNNPALMNFPNPEQHLGKDLASTLVSASELAADIPDTQTLISSLFKSEIASPNPKSSSLTYSSDTLNNEQPSSSYSSSPMNKLISLNPSPIQEEHDEKSVYEEAEETADVFYEKGIPFNPASFEYSVERFLPLLRELKRMIHRDELVTFKVSGLSLAEVRRTGIWSLEFCLKYAHYLKLVNYDGRMISMTELGRLVYNRCKGKKMNDDILDWRVPILEYHPKSYRNLISIILDEYVIPTKNPDDDRIIAPTTNIIANFQSLYPKKSLKSLGDVLQLAVNAKIIVLHGSTDLVPGSEKSLFCKDFNNGRCGGNMGGERKGKCKFIHGCMKCGDYFHREPECNKKNSLSIIPKNKKSSFELVYHTPSFRTSSNYIELLYIIHSSSQPTNLSNISSKLGSIPKTLGYTKFKDFVNTCADDGLISLEPVGQNFKITIIEPFIVNFFDGFKRFFATLPEAVVEEQPGVFVAPDHKTYTVVGVKYDPKFKSLVDYLMSDQKLYSASSFGAVGRGIHTKYQFPTMSAYIKAASDAKVIKITSRNKVGGDIKFRLGDMFIQKASSSSSVGSSKAPSPVVVAKTPAVLATAGSRKKNLTLDPKFTSLVYYLRNHYSTVMSRSQLGEKVVGSYKDFGFHTITEYIMSGASEGVITLLNRPNSTDIFFELNPIFSEYPKIESEPFLKRDSAAVDEAYEIGTPSSKEESSSSPVESNLVGSSDSRSDQDLENMTPEELIKLLSNPESAFREKQNLPDIASSSKSRSPGLGIENGWTNLFNGISIKSFLKSDDDEESLQKYVKSLDPGHQKKLIGMLKSLPENRSETHSSGFNISYKSKLPYTSVMVKGSWDNWKDEIPLYISAISFTNKQYEYVANIDMDSNQSSEYEYKFIIEGEWKIDDTKVIKEGDHGINNVLLLEQ